jgi:hypothetical protein
LFIEIYSLVIRAPGKPVPEAWAKLNGRYASFSTDPIAADHTVRARNTLPFINTPVQPTLAIYGNEPLT